MATARATRRQGAPRSLPSGRPVRHPFDDWGVWIVVGLMLFVVGMALLSIPLEALGVEWFDEPTPTTWHSGNGDTVVVR